MTLNYKALISTFVRTFLYALLLLITIAGLLVVLISVYHTLIWVSTVMWSRAILTILPPLTLCLAIGVAAFRQPVHNLLALIAVFFSIVALYVYVGAEFLAFLFLIVYVGAIAILFLFVIMLLHLKTETEGTPFYLNGALALSLVPAPFVVFGLDDMVSKEIEALFAIGNTLRTTASDSTGSLLYYVTHKFSDILLFSETLYTDHAFLFILASLLLLTAMLGAIVLATSATDAEETK